MGKELDKVVKSYISSQKNNFLNHGIKQESIDECTDAVEKQLTQKIYIEIKKEVRDEAIKEAQLEIDKTAEKVRISEFKKLTISGLVVAFFVGLLVNQITDFIGYYKGSVELDELWPTVMLSIVLLAICLAIICYLLISELIKILGKDK